MPGVLGNTRDPMGESAIAHWPTRTGLRRYLSRSFLLAMGAATIALVTTMITAIITGERPVFGNTPNTTGMVTNVAWSLASIFIVGGLCSFLRAARMRLVLARYFWSEFRCHFREVPMWTPNGQPILLLFEDGDAAADPSHTYSIPSWEWRWNAFNNLTCVWVAGPLGRWIVVSPPGGEELFVGRRPLLGPLRRYFERRALETVADETRTMGEEGP